MFSPKCLFILSIINFCLNFNSLRQIEFSTLRNRNPFSTFTAFAIFFKSGNISENNKTTSVCFTKFRTFQSAASSLKTSYMLLRSGILSLSVRYFKDLIAPGFFQISKIGKICQRNKRLPKFTQVPAYFRSPVCIKFTKDIIH
jgi:hypothetical protein